MKRRHQSPKASNARATRKKPARAKTSEILSKPGETARINPKWQHHYDKLLSLREELMRRRGSMEQAGREEQPSFSLHMADAATDEFDRDLAMSIASSEQEAVYEIEAALDRIRHGKYGVCEITGKPIEPVRLLAVPWARFSARAQRELEAKGAVKHVHLNPAGSITERFAAREDTEEPEREDQ